MRKRKRRNLPAGYTPSNASADKEAVLRLRRERDLQRGSALRWALDTCKAANPPGDYAVELREQVVAVLWTVAPWESDRDNEWGDTSGVYLVCDDGGFMKTDRLRRLDDERRAYELKVSDAQLKVLRRKKRRTGTYFNPIPDRLADEDLDPRSIVDHVLAAVPNAAPPHWFTP